MPVKLNLKDKKFERLTVIKECESRKAHTVWLCKCDCGNVIEVWGIHLTSGHSKSCGCLRKESCIERSTKHGHNQIGKVTPEYCAWVQMLSRCNNKNNNDYGGRGISVCERWVDSFSNFFEDMGKRPSKGYSIDRINNEGNYEPSNCRWATRKEQNGNTRKNRWHELNGVKMIQADWARCFLKSEASVRSMINRKGISETFKYFKSKNKLDINYINRNSLLNEKLCNY